MLVMNEEKECFTTRIDNVLAILLLFLTGLTCDETAEQPPVFILSSRIL